MQGISVVIPLYNKVRHIKRALDSVLAQTYRDFEVVAVNDGSTDGSEKVVERYADPRIRLVHQENAGVSAARNRGICEARADLIAFLDADDEWFPDHLAVINSLAGRYPQCGFFATGRRVEDERGNRRVVEFRGIPGESLEGIIDNYVRSFLNGDQLVHSSSVAVMRSCFKEVGLFLEGEHYGEDWEMWFRLLLRYQLAFSARACVLRHGDAVNRASAMPGKKDPYRGLRSTIDTAITRNDRHRDITRGDLVDLRHCVTIAAAREYLGDNRREDARRVLKECKPVGKYYRYWSRVYLYTFLPHPFFRLAVIAEKSLYGAKRRLRRVVMPFREDTEEAFVRRG